jgi:hypothetical protein
MDLPKLLGFIVQTSSISPRIKWIVSSHYMTNIKHGLHPYELRTGLGLELKKNTVHLIREEEVEIEILDTSNFGGPTQFRSTPSSKGPDNFNLMILLLGLKDEEVGVLFIREQLLVVLRLIPR